MEWQNQDLNQVCYLQSLSPHHNKTQLIFTFIELHCNLGSSWHNPE